MAQCCTLGQRFIKNAAFVSTLNHSSEKVQFWPIECSSGVVSMGDSLQLTDFRNNYIHWKVRNDASSCFLYVPPILWIKIRDVVRAEGAVRKLMSMNSPTRPTGVHMADSLIGWFANREEMGQSRLARPPCIIVRGRDGYVVMWLS